MVPAHDQMVGAEVAADQSVPDGLSGPGQSHGQRQQGQKDPLRIVVVSGQSSIGTNPCIVIDIARFGHTHDRVKQQCPIGFFGRSLDQFLVDAMQRIAGLKSHDIITVELCQSLAGLLGRQAYVLEVIVFGKL